MCSGGLYAYCCAMLLPTFSREIKDFKESTRYSLVNFEYIDKLYLLCALFGPTKVKLVAADDVRSSNLNPNLATWSHRLTTSCFIFRASDAILLLTERREVLRT